MALELVRMKHPDLEHVGELPVTTRQAFDDVWDGKGWELVEEDAAAGAPLEELTVAQLREHAAGLGVELESRATKAEIVAAIAAHQEG